VHRRLAGGASESFDRGRRRRKVRVAGSEVYYVDASREKLALPSRNVREWILRKAIEPRSEVRH